jgi:hypothetical protein
MSAHANHSLLNRRSLIALAVVEIVLFVLAGVTANSHSHPGTVSNIITVTYLIGVVPVLVLATALLTRSWKAAR